MADKETITRHATCDKQATPNAKREVHCWQLAHVTEGLRQPEAGEFASQSAVEAAFDRWRPEARKAPSCN